MATALLFVAAGQDRYIEEVSLTIKWHRDRGWNDPIELWIDPAWPIPSVDAEVRRLPELRTNLPPYTRAWYWKTFVLRHAAESGQHSFCLLDTYARILRMDAFGDAVMLSERFPACLALDPRGSIRLELKKGLGVSDAVRKDAERLPREFPIWNTGVVFGSPKLSSRELFRRVEKLSRAYLDRGLEFREQITFAMAVMETGLAPLTLPPFFNVRRPRIHPCVVLHTRRYGHLYGVPDVDEHQLRLESWRHRAKIALARLLRLETLD